MMLVSVCLGNELRVSHRSELEFALWVEQVLQSIQVLPLWSLRPCTVVWRWTQNKQVFSVLYSIHCKESRVEALARCTYWVYSTWSGTDSVLHPPSGWLQRCRRQQERAGNTLLMRSEHRNTIIKPQKKSPQSVTLQLCCIEWKLQSQYYVSHDVFWNTEVMFHLTSQCHAYECELNVFLYSLTLSTTVLATRQMFVLYVSFGNV